LFVCLFVGYLSCFGIMVKCGVCVSRKHLA